MQKSGLDGRIFCFYFAAAPIFNGQHMPPPDLSVAGGCVLTNYAFTHLPHVRNHPC